MSSQLIPVRLGVTAGDRYTLWAPRWRDGGDEWEAFLGRDEDIFAFESVADLVAFVRSDTDNDLVEHPRWAKLSQANAHRLLEKLIGSGRPGARLVYWNLLAPRRRPDRLAHRLRPLEELADSLLRRDKAFFYSALNVEEIL